MDHHVPLRIELRLDTAPYLVSITRRFVEQALERAVADDGDFVSRAAMAVHELLENATKYSADRCADLSLRIDGEGADRQLMVSLANDTSPGHVDRLKERFAEQERAPDALGYYVDLMRRNGPIRDISGLGLARIRAEGEMRLNLAVNGNRVTIVARAFVSPSGATRRGS